MPNTQSRPLLVLLLAFFFTAAADLSAQAPKFQTLHSFAGGANDGSYPAATVGLDAHGNVYGLTSEGGSDTTGCYGYGCGIAFELTPKSGRWKESVLYNFSGSSFPQLNSQIVVDSSGNVYGTQQTGGDPTCNCGLIFELTNVDGVWTEIVLHSFLGENYGDGSDPFSGLLMDAAGNLYGATGNGGSYNNSGTIFELSPAGDGTWSYSIVYQFGSTGSRFEAGFPYGPLSIDSSGNLYGTSGSGGTFEDGAVFKLSLQNGVWTESDLFGFTLNYGNYPIPNGVVIDSSGNLYGTLTYSGPNSVGSLYKLSPAVGFWNETVIHNFTGGPDGAYPYQLTMGPNNVIYGVANEGGAYGWGNVFQFAEVNGKWKQTVLHQFADKSDGAFPYPGVTLDSQGNLYGTTSEGGTANIGVAYEITP